MSMTPSPYINRFLSADTVVPGAVNPQAFNRYSYVLNNPVNFNDPTGHFACSNDRNSDDYCPGRTGGGSNGNGGSGGGDGGGNCPTPWPWMCESNPPEPEDPETPLDETSGSSGATPENWCGGDWCPGDVYFHQLDTDPIDARVISWSFAVGIGSWYFIYYGIDVVWTSQGAVVFLEEPAYLDPVYPHIPFSSSSDDYFIPVLVGESLTWGTITSADIRIDPSTEGIREAWSGLAVQEGGSYSVFTVNASSSADSAGNPNFLTTTQMGGFGVGISEVHQYVTNAVPYYQFGP